VLALAMPAILAVPVLFRVPLFRAIELASYDLRLRAEAVLRPMPVHPDIVILGIDDESLALLGVWPWPRRYWADVVEALAEFGARAVFLDATFPDPSDSPGDMKVGGESFRERVEKQLAAVPGEVTAPLGDLLKRPEDAGRVARAVAESLVPLRAHVQSHLTTPDSVFHESLVASRRSGMIVAGLATVHDVIRPAEVRVATARAEAQRWVLDHPDLPVKALPAALAALLAAELDELRLFRELYRCLQEQPDITLGSGLAPDLEAYARTHLGQVRQRVVEEECQGAMSLIATSVATSVATSAVSSPVSPDAVLRAPGLGRFRRLGRLTARIADHACARRLVPLLPVDPIARHVPDAPRAGALTPPVFAVASGLDVFGTDTIEVDPDGKLRSFPLFWHVPGGVMPSMGLAFFARLGAAQGAPAVSVEPGPVAAIQVREGRRGRTAARRGVRVPLTDRGQALIHWAGSYEDRFTKLPISLLLTYMVNRRDRESLFHDVEEYASALVYRDLTRKLAWTQPARRLSFDDLEAVARAADASFRPAADLATFLARLAPESQGRAADGLRPAAGWNAFFGSFLRAFEARKLSDAELKLRSIERAVSNPSARRLKAEPLQRMIEAQRRHDRLDTQLERALRWKLGGRICLVGHVASSSTDLAPTPFEPSCPKIAAHAHFLNTLLQERFIRRPPALAWTLGGLVDPATLQVPLLVMLAAGTSLALCLASGAASFAIALAIIAAWCGVALVSLTHYGLWLDMVSPVVGVSLTTASVHAWRSRRTERIREMFETYVDPRIVTALEEDETLWKELGGTEQRITAFISNVHGFTGICEVLTAQQVSDMLTDYLSPMTDVILSHGGTRDKYVGDSIVAVFGAPIATPSHPLQATLAALAQQDLLVELKRRWRRREVPWYEKLVASGRDLEFRIGVHSGAAKVGNFGSQRSKNYTVIGEAPNLALRLQQAAKEYGVKIVASELTVAALGGQVVTRPLDRVTLQGWVESLTLHEVIGRRETLEAVWGEVLPLYAQAMDFYYQGDYAKARALFDHILMIRPADGPSRHHLDRCTRLLDAPPPSGWDGRVTMTLR
jgi:class 3 adenylate cyclase